MANLPQGADLRHGADLANTPNIKLGALDYDPLARGGKAVGDGLSRLGQGIFDAGKTGLQIALEQQHQQEKQSSSADREGEDFETKKRLMDFKLATEMDLEEYKRNMPVGGEGYAKSWLDTYRERAAAFVGEADSNIPLSMRGKVGMALKQHEVMLAERAIRDQYAERDRETQAGLELTVSSHLRAVEADPNKHNQVQSDIGSLIDAARLTPPQRQVYRRKVQEAISEAAGRTWAERATSSQGLEAARAALGPDAPDSTSGPIPRDQFKADLQDPKIRADLIALAHAEVGSQGAVAQQQFIETVLNRAAARGMPLSQAIHDQKYFPEITRARVARGAPANVVDSYGGIIDDVLRGSNLARYGTGNASGTVGVGEVTASTNGERFGIENQAADRAWAERMKRTARPSGGAYTGPLAELPMAKRRALWERAQSVYEKAASTVAGAIKEYEANASNGILPPQEIMDDLKRRTEAINDPRVTAQFNSTFQFAGFVGSLNKLPPQAIEGVANQMAQQLGDRMTPEQGKRLQQVRTIEENVRRQVNADPLTYAAKVGLPVPVVPPQGEPAAGSFRAGQEQGIAPRVTTGEPVKLESLDFNAPDINDRLKRRAETAQSIGQFYGQPAQYFTKIERDVLKDTLANGGQGLLFTLGKMQQAWGTEGLLSAMKEVHADHAPEVAMIGRMMATGGNQQAIADAAEGLKLRRQQGFMAHVDQKMRAPEVQTASQVFAKMPGMIDPVTRVADTIYETRHRTKGLKEFDVAEYRKIIGEVMGETTAPDGTKFGGVGYQGTGFFDGKWQTPVQVPPTMRQDAFDRVVGSITTADLATQPKPMFGNGKPMQVADIKRASFVTAGVGKYLLQTGTDASGEPQFAVDRNGNPYVLDMNAMEPELKRRNPEYFRPDAVAPKPAWTYQQPAATPPPAEQPAAPRSGAERRTTMPRVTQEP